jgi:hypothetical protein
MSVPEPSMDLNKWDLNLINHLINFPAVESETFDFKGARLNGLEIHICAMANTSGGILALGIEEPSTPGLPFVKSGFTPSKKNSMPNDIGNYSHMVEPHPNIDTKTIEDANGKFYTILKVERRDIDVPYAIKDRGQFYVRVGASSRPASRNTVLNLFSGLQQRLRDIERLRASCLVTRSSYVQIAREMNYRSTAPAAKITPLDLSLLKNAVVQSEWFLADKNLLGGMIKGGSRSGAYTHLHSFERMNTYIAGFNNSNEAPVKDEMKGMLYEWGEGRGTSDELVAFLDDVARQCATFIKEKSLT